MNRGQLVLLVDPDSGRELATLEPPPESPQDVGRLAFSPDGSRLAVPIDNEILVWDLRLIRAQLAEMGLDWDAPPLPTPEPAESTPAPLRVHLEGIDWMVAASQGEDHAQEGRWDKALTDYNQALALGADDPGRLGPATGSSRSTAGTSTAIARAARPCFAGSARTTGPGCSSPRPGPARSAPDALSDWKALVPTVEAAAARDPQNVMLQHHARGGPLPRRTFPGGDPGPARIDPAQPPRRQRL